MSLFPTMLAYIGPETVVPLASVLAAIGGVFMMFWSTIRRWLTWCLRNFKRDSSK